jgi:hypothetical protein
MDRNKRLCELLRVEWHENDYIWEGDRLVNLSPKNPDFSSDPGKIELLRLMDKKDGWLSCAIAKGIAWNFRGELFINQEYLTDTAGKFADAALEFLEEKRLLNRADNDEQNSYAATGSTGGYKP